MRKNASWVNRYLLSISEELTIKDIMILRNVGQPKALEIRKKSICFCINNNIELTSFRVPTRVVLEITNLSSEFYYNNMLKEIEVNNLLSNGAKYVYS